MIFQTICLICFVAVAQLLCRVWLFATPLTAPHKAPLSSTASRSLLKPMSIESWCHPAISSSVVPFSSCPQSFPASGSFQMSQLFASGGQSVGVSASASVLPMNTQDWFPYGWTGWISLQSKGLSRVFSNTIIQKQPFFSIRSSVRKGDLSTVTGAFLGDSGLVSGDQCFLSIHTALWNSRDPRHWYTLWIIFSFFL